jgi:protein TonB
MGMLSLILAISAAVDGKPATDPSTWVVSNDYPKSEMNRAAEGTTGFTLAVNKNGAVDDCAVTSSSGSAVLDATACALLKVRARFEPARDAAGRKAAFTYSSGVRWQLPGNMSIPVPEQQQTTIAIDVSDKGIVEDCSILQRPKGASPDDNRPCISYPAGRKMRNFADADGKPVAVRISVQETESFEIRR